MVNLKVKYFDGRWCAVCADDRWYGDFASKSQAEFIVNASNEYENLKQANAELIALIKSIPNDIADCFEWFEANDSFIDEMIDKHEK